MAIKTLRVFAEYTSTGFVPMPTAGNIDYGYTLASTFPSSTPSSFQTDDPDLDVTVTAMTDFYVWIRINGTAWNPSYTRNVRVYPDSPDINNVVMNMIIATGPAGTSAYSQIVQTSNRLYFNGATTDTIYNSKFAGKTYINELNFGTAPQLATVATSGAYADLTGKPALSTVATSGSYADLSNKPSGTAPLSYNSGTNSFQITQASTSTNGSLSSADWNTFNNKQGTITLTTSGTSGASTFVGNTLNIPNYAPNLSVYVPYTGATTNVNLGTHSLTAADLVVNHVSGSGVAASITKGGNGEALTVVKTSGSGNAASITGGVTLLDELHLNTDLADAYIGSATNWNTAYTNRIVSASAPLSITSNAISISQANTTTNGFLSSTDWNTFNSKQNALTIGNFTEVNSNVFMFPDGTTGKTIGNLSIQMIQAGASTNGYLSSTDWSTFNNKQNVITLSTTGTSGASTFSAGTLNIPQYQGAITLTTTGTSGAATFSANTLNIPQYVTDLSGLVTLTTAQTISGAKTFSSALNGTSATFSSNINGTGESTYMGLDAATVPRLGFVKIAGSQPFLGFAADPFTIRVSSGSTIATSNTFSTALTITTGGQLGVNVTPPIWFTNFKGLNLSNGSLVAYSTNGSIFLSQNTYFNASGSWTYLNTGTAGQYSIDGVGNHVFYRAVSGSAGASATLLETMRITSAGNVGIGTSSPAELLHISKIGSGTVLSIEAVSGNDAALKLKDQSRSYYIGTDSGNLYVYDQTGAKERMRITSAGRVGINTSSPAFALTVANPGGTAGISIDSSSTSYQSTLYYTRAGVGKWEHGMTSTNEDWYLYGSDWALYVVRSSGNVLVGTSTNSGEKLYVAGSIRATGNITANSDLTLKKNLKLIESPTDKLMLLNGYSYQWKENNEYQYGVIAQEVEKVMSYAVQTGSNGIKGVAYNQLTPLLIEGFKVHETELQTLKKRVAYLETKLG
jgi:hypothetical protein